MIELLAPAGSFESACAAFSSGADAVYLGLDRFSARAEADNFSMDQLDNLLGYAQSLAEPRKVFVTMNTLLKQSELNNIIPILEDLAFLKPHALIVQDFGLARIAKEHFPELNLHASTQAVIHNAEGARAMKAAGFKRVIVARELTLEEIRTSVKDSGLEIEAFIHGALCYSYSGLCLYSSHMTGRSGNRGRCAYCCRDRFYPQDYDSGLLFSMKDLALGPDVQRLAKTGITSLKIEGRMKSPLYTAAVTDYYRTLLDANPSECEERALRENLKTIFSRPTTTFFFEGERTSNSTDKETIGHRGAEIGTVERIFRRGKHDILTFTTSRNLMKFDGIQFEIPGVERPYGFSLKEMSTAGNERSKPAFEIPAGQTVEAILDQDHPKIPAGTTIYCSSSQEVKKQFKYRQPKPGEFRKRKPVDFTVSLTKDGIHADAVLDNQKTASAFKPFTPQPATKPKVVEAGVERAFSKLGETTCSLDKLAFQNPEELFVPVSELNSLRRDLIKNIETKLSKQKQSRIQAITSAITPKPEPASSLQWSIKIDKAEYLNTFTKEELYELSEILLTITPADIYEQLEALSENIEKQKIRLSLPAICKKRDHHAVTSLFKKLTSDGWLKWEASNLYGKELASDIAGIDMTAGWQLYAMNSCAARELLTLGFTGITSSPEDQLDNIQQLAETFGSTFTTIIYQDTPLFTSEVCGFQSMNDSCPGEQTCNADILPLRSPKGHNLLMINENCRTIVINQKPFCFSNLQKHLPDHGTRRLDFLHRPYTPEDIHSIFRNLRDNQPIPYAHQGNLTRGLL